MTQNENLKIHIEILEVLKRTCQQIKEDEYMINDYKAFSETCRRGNSPENEKINYGWARHFEGEKRAKEYLVQAIGSIFVKSGILRNVKEISLDAAIGTMKTLMKGDNKK